MAEPKNEQKNQPDMKALLIDALRSMSQDELATVLRASGAAPTTIGMTQDTMQMLIGSMQKTSATAMREALRSQRKENPSYPEKSVFNPRGVYDDAGNPQPAKLKFRIPTFYNSVRLGGELETEEEIELCNRFTEAKYARDGLWSAEIEGKGARQRLLIKTPSNTIDERNSVPPFSFVLRELLDGADAVNPETLQRQIEELRKQIAAMQPAGTAA